MRTGAISVPKNTKNKSIANLLKLVEKGAESDTLAARLTDLEKQKRDAERRLIIAEDDYIILEREHIIWWLSKFLNGDIEDEEFRRQIIDLLVNSVTVWDEPDGWYKITTVYNLMDQNTQTFRVKPDGSSDLRSQLPPACRRSQSDPVRTKRRLVPWDRSSGAVRYVPSEKPDRSGLSRTCRVFLCFRVFGMDPSYSGVPA